MAELTISQIIKLIIGVVVFVVVVGGVFFFFRDRVGGFFDSIINSNSTNLILNLLKV